MIRKMQKNDIKIQSNQMDDYYLNMKVRLLILSALSQMDMTALQLTEMIQPLFNSGVHGIIIVLLHTLQNEGFVSLHHNLEKPTIKIWHLEPDGCEIFFRYREDLFNFVNYLK